ncbi:hypothetical protein BH10BDE1_BH10BDE1_34830 [soil metagenome]
MKSQEFDSFKDFFEFNLKEAALDQNGKKVLTLQELAEKLGYSSASTLSMVAKGQRLPTTSLLEALFQIWKTKPAERERIRLNVEIERREKKGKPVSTLADKFNRLGPYHKIDLTGFKLIRNWYVMVIKLLVGGSDFKEDAALISRRLRKKVTPKQVKESIQLLESSGLVTRDPATKRLQPAKTNTETSHEITSEAIRANHRGMISRALEAIEEQTTSQRQFNSLALQFDAKNLKPAKDRILEFVKDFNEEFGSEDGNEVYQLNVQFFEHTDEGTRHDS